MEVLSDDVTEKQSAAVQKISGVPFDQRIRFGKDHGETMVIPPATVAADAGEHVIVLIYGGGQRAAATEARQLQRLNANGKIHTVTVLERAAGSEHLPDKYGRLRTLDDGLQPMAVANLMTLPCWQ